MPLLLPPLLIPFVGIVCVMLGGLIVTFDYPQIQYLEGGSNANNDVVAPSALGQEIYGRLITEFYVGVALLATGAVLCAPFAISKILQKRVGQR